ncbi:hypothetical protein [Neobacillus sp. 19]|uniref:hypothetical protein n=1 Tax=Neobacillus sp. 19 TaxID=3394458 RepID=UPI003BF65B63
MQNREKIPNKMHPMRGIGCITEKNPKRNASNEVDRMQFRKISPKKCIQQEVLDAFLNRNKGGNLSGSVL